MSSVRFLTRYSRQWAASSGTRRLLGQPHTYQLAFRSFGKNWLYLSFFGGITFVQLTPYILFCVFFAFKNSCLAAEASAQAGIPDSIKRVGTPEAFPNQYPGHIYAFNWCLNGDGVTPLRGSAFRITKPLDLKVAGLDAPKQNPLQVCFPSFSDFHCVIKLFRSSIDSFLFFDE